MIDLLAGQPIRRRQLLLAAGLLFLSALPHWWHLRPPVMLAFLVLLTARLLFWPRPAKAPPGILRLLLVLLALALVIHQAGLTESRLFGVALLVAMSGLKLLEMKSRRELYLLAFLGLFLLASQFLFSNALLLTLWVLLVATGWIAFLVEINTPSGAGERPSAVATAALLMVGGVPVMLLLFVLFPRLDGPLWSLQLKGATAITGVSDQIAMGTIASLGQSEAVAFRVRFDGEPPPESQRYWRGMVLWHTDGRRWWRQPAPAMQSPPPPHPEGLGYEVTMEPSGQPWLFPLDRVVSAERPLRLDDDATLQATAPIEQRFTFRATSLPPPLHEALDERARRLGLELPARVSPRVRALAQRWRRQAADDAQVVQLALAHFRRQPFVYTLQPPLLRGDPVDGFLFETRKGFCEHYATSFVLLMRLAGIPARVVVGYQGGEINPVAGHLVVRQSDAHAWAEVWLAGRGWTRVDPTAAVAPERVERGIEPQPAPVGAPARFRVEVDVGLLQRVARRIGWYRDSLQLAWHYWVVGYDRQRQASLLDRMGLSRLQGYRLAIVAVLGALAAGTLFFYLGMVLGRRRRDPLPAAWRRFRRKLARQGLTLPTTTGPLDSARAAMRRFPARAGEIKRIVDLYVALRYGEQHQPEKLRELRRRVARLRL